MADQQSQPRVDEQSGRQTKPPAETPRCWTSEQLLGGHQEVTIRHGAELYRLRLTRQGKLILHK